MGGCQNWRKKEGDFSAQCLKISGAVTEAETRQEVHENMKDAILLVLASQRHNENRNPLSYNE
jgi:predicted RNase H-like HicB family nuclease